MPRAVPQKQSIPPAPARVDGIVFHLALSDDRWVETIGVPFEHRGRTWAVHRSTFSDPSMPAVYAVSDVETGRSVGQIMECTIDAARAVAIEKIDRATPEQWAAVVPTPQPRKSRARAAVA
ncbi:MULTISPECIES: hypothetical protein [Burkholderia]|uniref:hypothetical protein n=1 Tax=Burkholderia TaxID=32008 RepID=UPI0013DEBB3E|nr:MULTISPECIES: hypothetical protein [Burkholderia]MCA8081830.1 hypothetical protein [Burkholderia cepacia]MCW3504571.1 hypothetical protein [Burkholderia cenocepacia]MCW3512033.1 hypothetical protein [Burkholderia cenocepacia]MCW3519634.1 hypothetical protein [Burkholderia cenocepacia]MCW3534992.1 hypothetical protein [Burkholderia cenocepacia]